MDNLGLVFDTTNPFVNTGIPRTGQVWFRKKVVEHMAHILGYDEYNDTVLYKILEDHRDNRVKLACSILHPGGLYRIPLYHFLKVYRFSH